MAVGLAPSHVVKSDIEGIENFSGIDGSSGKAGRVDNGRNVVYRLSAEVNEAWAPGWQLNAASG
jgi:hypothetical protein